MESERKSKTLAKRFLSCFSCHRVGKIRPVVTTLKTAYVCHFEEAILNLQRVLILSFSSHCQGAEGGGHMGFRCQQPLGLPQAHLLCSHQASLPDTPHLSLHRLALGVKQSLLKANGILLGLCFITQTLCCFSPMVVAYHSSLPVGEDQGPHICVLADDSLPH